MDVQVDFRYRTYDSAQWVTLPITAEEYFDTSDRRDKERLDLYFVEQYLDVRRFLSEPYDSIRGITIRLNDPELGYDRRLEYAYWNHGKCVLIRRESTVPNEKKEEIVVQIVIPEPHISTTVKFQPKDDGVLIDEYVVNIDGEMHEHLPDNERVDLQ